MFLVSVNESERGVLIPQIDIKSLPEYRGDYCPNIDIGETPKGIHFTSLAFLSPSDASLLE